MNVAILNKTGIFYPQRLPKSLVFTLIFFIKNQ